MDEKSKKKQQYEDYEWTPLNWRAWGSWFSWGSPVGLALFYGISAVSTGVMLWLLHLAGLVGK